MAGDASSAAASQGGSQLSIGKHSAGPDDRRVALMIPFVAAGGLLIALGFLFGGFDIALKAGATGARTCADLASWVDAETCASGD